MKLLRCRFCSTVKLGAVSARRGTDHSPPHASRPPLCLPFSPQQLFSPPSSWIRGILCCLQQHSKAGDHTSLLGFSVPSGLSRTARQRLWICGAWLATSAKKVLGQAGYSHCLFTSFHPPAVQSTPSPGQRCSPRSILACSASSSSVESQSELVSLQASAATGISPFLRPRKAWYSRFQSTRRSGGISRAVWASRRASQ